MAVVHKSTYRFLKQSYDLVEREDEVMGKTYLCGLDAEGNERAVRYYKDEMIKTKVIA